MGSALKVFAHEVVPFAPDGRRMGAEADLQGDGQADMRKRFNEVLVLCPEYKNGGCEALHQLAHQINRNGGTAYMVYYGPFSRLELDGEVLRCHLGDSEIPAYYAAYQPQVLRETRPGADTLIVFPEVLTELAAVPSRCQRAVWWLSVDNGIQFNRALTEDSYRKQYFVDPGLVHFYQCDYARAFLQANGAGQYYPLSDFTDPGFVYRSLASADPPVLERGNSICFFPNKGAALAERFIEGRGTLGRAVDFVPICAMSKAQVRDALFGARIYIDFGHHPGKDRVPREAAIAGAVVLLHAAGAARHFVDHPLPADYFFSEEDVATGRLHRTVAGILGEIERHSDAQLGYRDAILHERERFDLEVRSYFFSGV